MVWSSFADWKGRRPLYIISILIYILANVLLAAVPTDYGALIVLRVVQAFGSSAVVSLGAGTVADVRVTFRLFKPLQRANLNFLTGRLLNQRSELEQCHTSFLGPNAVQF